ncbi:helix-turn-helix domain-containing protein [Pontixanthobacter sp. CEM42]|uniref:helix-turn-helix domain-containing protein n=1 Tax=Pontixanthobacter sp. CEM42 TaxID=2792077 RepID=UPI001AE0D79F|nr:helix-turn-helix domain-containing protein [Pontixanthobacter sp. CEM42]
MSEEGDQLEGELPLEGAGQRLARARADADKTVEQIAAETRIPTRHLETLESGDFAALPAKTYAIGFARTYARAVGLDEQEIAQQVRDELDNGDGGEAHRGATFEPGDPARLPSRGLAWFSVFAVVILLVGSFAYFRDYFMPGSGPGPITSEEAAVAAEASADGSANGDTTLNAEVAPTGAVVFTSLENDVWVRFYDSSGERLMEKIMTQGESYTVPADANGPQIRTGRPEALVIRIGGKSIGTLSNRSETVGDLPVTADALVARIADLEAQPAASSGDEQTTG